MKNSKIIDNCIKNSTADLDFISTFNEIRTQKFNNAIIGNLKINFLAFKFDNLRLLVTGIFDTLIITETKLDDAFPLSQFHMDGFSTPYRLDRNTNDGGIIIYIREDISSKTVTKNIEALFIELNYRKCKWFLCGLCHPPSQKDQYFFHNVDKALDVSSTYVYCIDTFIYHHNLQSMNKELSCYKNPNNPSSIDLFPTNSPRKFLPN